VTGAISPPHSLSGLERGARGFLQTKTTDHQHVLSNHNTQYPGWYRVFQLGPQERWHHGTMVLLWVKRSDS
jgi:hypothetical protein